MRQVNVLEAKNGLSALLSCIENKKEQEIVIARRGKPIARLVPYAPDVTLRVGVASSERLVAQDLGINEYDDEIAQLFGMA